LRKRTCLKCLPRWVVKKNLCVEINERSGCCVVGFFLIFFFIFIFFKSCISCKDLIFCFFLWQSSGREKHTYQCKDISYDLSLGWVFFSPQIWYTPAHEGWWWYYSCWFGFYFCKSMCTSLADRSFFSLVHFLL